MLSNRLIELCLGNIFACMYIRAGEDIRITAKRKCVDRVSKRENVNSKSIYGTSALNLVLQVQGQPLHSIHTPNYIIYCDSCRKRGRILFC